MLGILGITGLALKKKVKVWFSGETNERMLLSHPLVRSLSEFFNVVLTKDCDFLFINYKDYVYNKEFLKKDCVRIFFSTENIYPDYNVIDYALCPNYSPVGDRFLWLPFYWWDEDSWKLLNLDNMATDWEEREKFCSFIVSNGNAEPSRLDNKRSNREIIFDELSKYKKIDSPGRFKNNHPPIEVDPSTGKTYYLAKIDFMRNYRFALACENSSSPGNTTEKIVHAFLAGCIPIYWGDPKICEQFKEGTFIWIKDEDDISDAIKKIKNIDSGKESHLPYTSVHPKYLEPFHNICTKEYVDNYLVSVLSQNPLKARRRSKYFLNERYESNMSVGLDFRPDSEFKKVDLTIPPEHYLPHTQNIVITGVDDAFKITVENDWKGYIETFGGRFTLPAPPYARKYVSLPESVEKIVCACNFESAIPVIVTPYIMQYDNVKDLKTDYKDSYPMEKGEVIVESKRHADSTNFRIAIRLIRQDRKNETFEVKLSKINIALKNKIDQ